MIDQQEGTEAGASGGDLGAPFSLSALCEERTYSPPASWWWYGLRPSCALRGLAPPSAFPCQYIQQTPTTACASDAAAPITGGLGAFGHQQAAQGIYLRIACHYQQGLQKGVDYHSHQRYTLCVSIQQICDWKGISIMDNKSLKGIALILFGILLCLGGAEINSTLLHSLSDFPFSLLGVIVGAVGLSMIFTKNTDKKDE